jgi:hypothetical protein
MELLFEAAGWVGAAAILGAFLSVSMGWLKAGRAFQTANLLGACAFIINGAFHEAWPSVVSNIVWFLISAVALIRLRPVRHMPGVPEPTGPLPIIDASSESGAAGKRDS